jgi:hypothetical protein
MVSRELCLPPWAHISHHFPFPSLPLTPLFSNVINLCFSNCITFMLRNHIQTNSRCIHCFQLNDFLLVSPSSPPVFHKLSFAFDIMNLFVCLNVLNENEIGENKATLVMFVSDSSCINIVLGEAHCVCLLGFNESIYLFFPFTRRLQTRKNATIIIHP